MICLIHSELICIYYSYSFPLDSLIEKCVLICGIIEMPNHNFESMHCVNNNFFFVFLYDSYEKIVLIMKRMKRKRKIKQRYRRSKRGEESKRRDGRREREERRGEESKRAVTSIKAYKLVKEANKTMNWYFMFLSIFCDDVWWFFFRFIVFFFPLRQHFMIRMLTSNTNALSARIRVICLDHNKKKRYITRGCQRTKETEINKKKKKKKMCVLAHCSLRTESQRFN